MNEASKYDLHVGDVIEASIVGMGIIYRIMRKSEHHIVMWVDDEIMTSLDIEEIDYVVNVDVYV